MFKKIKSLMLIILASFLNLAYADYDYPIGVPEAWVSPDIKPPEQPLDWSEEVPNFYYVNPGDINCINDDEYIYGTPSVPICRVPVFLSQGAYVYLDGTNYSYTSTLYFRASGTEANPVWLVGSDSFKTSQKYVVSGTYFYMHNLHFSGSRIGIEIRPYQGNTTNHIAFLNSTITGTGSDGDSSALASKGESGSPISNIIAYNNEISYNGKWDSDSLTKDAHAMQTGSYITNVWYLGNHTHHNGGDGVQFSHGGKEVSHLYYAGNYSHHERENCVDIKQADDVVISSNVCHSINRVDSANGECMVVHYDPSRIWFINNDISDCDYGIMSTGSFDLYAIGNNIHDMHEWEGETHSNISTYQTGGAINAYSTGYLYAINNTITNAVRGISYEAGNYFPTITGNIITNLKDGEYSGNKAMNVLVKGSSSSSNQTVFENNLFYNPSSVYITNTTYTNGPSMKEAIGKCALDGCITEDPQYEEYPTNLRLKSTSPAVDAGLVSSVYQTFFDLYGLDIEADLNYITRYETPDMGAYESNQNVLPRYPIAAEDIYVNVNTGELSWVPLTLDALTYTIYKNGNVLDDEVSGDSTSYGISGITGSKDSYKIGTTNSKGYVVSKAIESDDISFSRTTNVSVALDSDKSWSVFRQGKYSQSGNAVISYPSYSGNPYGIALSRAAFSNGGERFTGYVYLKGDSKESISGTVGGTGSASMYFVDSNYSNNIAKSEITINDSKIFVETDKGFNQTVVTLGLDGTVNNYSYEVTEEDPKSIIGISAIIEQ